MKNETYWRFHEKVFTLWKEVLEAHQEGKLTLRDIESLGASWRSYTRGARDATRFDRFGHLKSKRMRA